MTTDESPATFSPAAPSLPEAFQGILKERRRQFAGITIVYLLLGLGCLFFRRGDPDLAPQDFLLHGAVVFGLSILYLTVACLTLHYYNTVATEWIQRIPSSVEDILSRAKARGGDESRLAAYRKIIKRSTGYFELLGIKTSVYSEIRFMQDFSRLICPVVFIFALNLGKNGVVEILVLVAAVLFLWISTQRYQKILDFIASQAD